MSNTERNALLLAVTSERVLSDGTVLFCYEDGSWEQHTWDGLFVCDGSEPEGADYLAEQGGERAADTADTRELALAASTGLPLAYVLAATGAVRAADPGDRADLASSLAAVLRDRVADPALRDWLGDELLACQVPLS